ncbi:hypothetical protein [Scytonema sp. NUACC21]
MKNRTLLSSSTPNHPSDSEPKKPSEKKPQHWNWRTLFRIMRDVGSVLSVITTFLKILQELGLL